MTVPETPKLQIEIQDVDWHKWRELDWRFLGEFSLEAAGFLPYKNATSFSSLSVSTGAVRTPIRS